MAPRYDIGDYVWAKMRGYSIWPAQIINPPESSNSRRGNYHFVFFYGTKNHAWISEPNLYHHTFEMLEIMTRKKKSRMLRTAIQDFLEEMERPSEEETDEESEETDDESNILNFNNERFENFLMEQFTPMDKMIGVIGLDIIGAGVAKNLLISGHKVTVWDRVPEKCQIFVNAGAKSGETPSEVAVVADVIIVCTADPEVVFGNEGAIKGFQNCEIKKGFIEMSSIRMETSKTIAKAIANNGGSYVKAHFWPSTKQAIAGTLVLTVSGDVNLYNEYLGCFSAISAEHTFMDDETAYCVNAATTMFQSTLVAGMVELVALFKRLELPLEHIETYMKTSKCQPKIMQSYLNSISKNRFPTDVPLKYAFNDMNTSIRLTSEKNVSLSVTRAAINKFAEANKKGYGNHDISTVYSAYK